MTVPLAIRFCINNYNKVNKMKICIATNKAPSDFPAFLQSVKRLAEDSETQVNGYVIIGATNCCNHGIIVEGPKWEFFANALTMALMPARWTIVSDNDAAVSVDQFEMIGE